MAPGALSSLDASSAVASWLSLLVTTVGLAGIVSQAAAINNRLDPFHANRNTEYLGVWILRQRDFPWYVLSKAPPIGPIITANLADGFCNRAIVYLTRVPLVLSGQASWAALLSVVHVKAPTVRRSANELDAEKGPAIEEKGKSGMAVFQINGQFKADPTQWHYLEHRELVRHQSHACVAVSRTTLIAMMALTNARRTYQHSDASGFRAGYASYSGQWSITWPIGQEAIARMLAGVISAPNSGLQVAFTGRKRPGTYKLLHRVKGFPGAHGSRHLYNMMGGRVYEIDFLSAQKVDSHAEEQDDNETDDRVFYLPSTTAEVEVKMIVSHGTCTILAHAVDCLPWSTLSWSIHRGLRDLIMAYTKPVMDFYRAQLAEMLRLFVISDPEALDRRGWNPTFVRSSMGDMAHGAIMSGSGDSGDLVRVVTSVVNSMIGDDAWDYGRLDCTWFWRRLADKGLPGAPEELDAEAVVALTKVFIVEWSNEFDYQLYHNMPISLYFV